jgi:hypothetical protein
MQVNSIRWGVELVLYEAIECSLDPVHDRVLGMVTFQRLVMDTQLDYILVHGIWSYPKKGLRILLFIEYIGLSGNIIW